VARLGDPDPIRQRLRAALASRDRKALLALARATETARLSPTSFALLGKALIEVGEGKIGLDVLRQGQRLHPRDFWLNFLLGEEFLATQPVQAARFYTVALSLRPRSPALLVELGNALSVAGYLDEAAACFDEAIALARNFAMPRFNLGLARSRQGRHTEAVAAYQAAIRRRPDYPEAYNNLGNSLLELERVEEAIANYKHATKLKPTHALAHLNLGMAYELLGDADRAIPAFRTAANLTPQAPLPRLYLGRMLQRKGRLSGAVAAIRRADELGAGPTGLGYPSREWLAEAERLLELEPRLELLLAGKVKPVSPEERLDWAQLCLCKDRPVRAAELYREAFRQKPALAEQPIGQRFGAALAATLAGFGRGKDAGKLNETERAAWRNQALQWLRADLGLWARQLAASPAEGRRVRLTLSHWRFDIALAGVRDPDELKKLPAAEREQWRKFWDEVEALERKAGKH
jgi:tetratricopeptide (TPR) repeat protein